MVEESCRIQLSYSEKHKIEMLDWFANSLDFNLIEQIRALMMKRIPVWK